MVQLIVCQFIGSAACKLAFFCSKGCHWTSGRQQASWSAFMTVMQTICSSSEKRSMADVKYLQVASCFHTRQQDAARLQQRWLQSTRTSDAVRPCWYTTITLLYSA